MIVFPGAPGINDIIADSDIGDAVKSYGGSGVIGIAVEHEQLAPQLHIFFTADINWKGLMVG
jgi:hypothetical protein